MIKKNTNRTTIVVVDDDRFNLKMMEKLIDRLGFKCLYVAGSSEAIDVFKLHKDKIALIFMDCKVPNMNGFKTTAQIAEVCEETKLKKEILPIFGLTGHVQDSCRIKPQKSGMTHKFVN